MSRTGHPRLFAGRYCFRFRHLLQKRAPVSVFFYLAFTPTFYFTFLQSLPPSADQKHEYLVTDYFESCPEERENRKETKKTKREQRQVTRNPCSANRIHLYLGSFCLSPKSLSLRRRSPQSRASASPLTRELTAAEARTAACLRPQPSSYPMQARRGRGDSGPRPPSSR